LPDAVLIHVDQKIAYVNNQTVRMLGATGPEELIGRDSLSFVPDGMDHMKELFRSRQERSLAGAVSQSPVRQKRVRLDGTVIDVETVSSFIEWEGRPGLIGVMRDITERVEAERRYSAVTENMPGAVFQRVLSPEGEVSFPYVSHGITAIIGHDAESIMRDSTPMMEALHPDFRDEYRNLL
jgi:PAS domain S-box-containing protein